MENLSNNYSRILFIGLWSSLGLIHSSNTLAQTQAMVSPSPTPTPNIVKPQKLSAPNVSVSAPNTAVNSGGKNSFIDTRNYRPTPPPVVFQERNSTPVVKQPAPNPRSRARNLVQQPPVTTTPVQTVTNVTRQIVANQTNNVVRRTRPPLATQSQTLVAAVPVQPIPYHRATEILPQVEKKNTSLIYPVVFPSAITSIFGWRVHPIFGDRRMHTGTDIGAPMGTPVVAVYPGKVETVGEMGGYGLIVILRHEDNTQESRYAHLSQIAVQPGEWVEQGTVIGLVGNTGNSTGPHLHFEWRHRTESGWVAVDAGPHLQYAMQNLTEAIVRANSPKPKLAQLELNKSYKAGLRAKVEIALAPTVDLVEEASLNIE